MKGKLLTFVFVLALILAATVGTVGAAPKGGLSVSISADKASFSATDSVLVTVTITNPGKNPAKVLKWLTPAEDVEESLFTVTRDGAAVNYVGAHYKRSAPANEDYLVLKGGQSITRVVDLGAYYDLSASGNYEIEYNVGETGLSSNKIQAGVEGRAGATASVNPLAVTGSTSFNRCTTSQQSDLTTARSNASNYAANAVSYLNAGTVSSRYTTWFGVYSAGRYNTVKSNFINIQSAMDTAAVTFDCSCKKKTTYAYVYSNQPYNIYLCGAFWSAPALGTDSKAGTLIHEMSHFSIVAGTNDHAYGQTNAKALAISNPANAVNNADNHEYFAENTPALP